MPHNRQQVQGPTRLTFCMTVLSRWPPTADFPRVLDSKNPSCTAAAAHRVCVFVRIVCELMGVGVCMLCVVIPDGGYDDMMIRDINL